MSGSLSPQPRYVRSRRRYRDGADAIAPYSLFPSSSLASSSSSLASSAPNYSNSSSPSSSSHSWLDLADAHAPTPRRRREFVTYLQEQGHYPDVPTSRRHRRGSLVSSHLFRGNKVIASMYEYYMNFIRTQEAQEEEDAKKDAKNAEQDHSSSAVSHSAASIPDGLSQPDPFANRINVLHSSSPPPPIQPQQSPLPPIQPDARPLELLASLSLPPLHVS